MRLSEFVDVLSQARFVACSSVLVNDALIHRLIDQRDRRCKSFAASGFVVCAKSCTKLLDLRAKLAAVCTVDSVTFFVLPNSLFG